MMYRRLVLEFGHCAPPSDSLRDAADFARLLGIGLHGLFIEDESLFGVAELGFAREWRFPGAGWTALDAGQIAEDLRGAAASVRQQLARLGVPNAFEVIRGDPALCVAERVTTRDIVVLAPMGAATSTAARLQQAVADSAGAVLLLPSRRRRTHGAVAAIVADAADPAWAAADAIARAAHESLHVFTAGDAAEDVSAGHVHPIPDSVSLAEALGSLQERLIVMTRDHNVAAAVELAQARGVPVLLVEPVTEGGDVRPG